MSTAATMTVEAKVVGQRKRAFSDWQIPLPPEARGGSPITLRDLITYIVIREVQAFRERQDERRLARILSADEIAQGATRGKIDMGERDLQQEVNENAAIAAALQAFEDGLYVVFVDDAQQERLDQTVVVGADSHLMFVRLVALAGG
jgi:hypothetical protein